MFRFSRPKVLFLGDKPTMPDLIVDTNGEIDQFGKRLVIPKNGYAVLTNPSAEWVVRFNYTTGSGGVVLGREYMLALAPTGCSKGNTFNTTADDTKNGLNIWVSEHMHITDMSDDWLARYGCGRDAPDTPGVAGAPGLFGKWSFPLLSMLRKDGG